MFPLRDSRPFYSLRWSHLAIHSFIRQFHGYWYQAAWQRLWHTVEEAQFPFLLFIFCLNGGRLSIWKHHHFLVVGVGIGIFKDGEKFKVGSFLLFYTQWSSEITSGGLRRPDEIMRIEPGLAMCMGSTLCTILSLWPWIWEFLLAIPWHSKWTETEPTFCLLVYVCGTTNWAEGLIHTRQMLYHWPTSQSDRICFWHLLPPKKNVFWSLVSSPIPLMASQPLQ